MGAARAGGSHQSNAPNRLVGVAKGGRGSYISAPDRRFALPYFAGMAGRGCFSRASLRAAQSLVAASRSRSAPAPAPAPASALAAALPEQDAVPADAVPAHGTHLRQRPAPPPQPRTVNFSDAREAFRSKTSGELLRGLLVLRLCALEPLVQRAEQVSRDPPASSFPGRAERAAGETVVEPSSSEAVYLGVNGSAALSFA